MSASIGVELTGFEDVEVRFRRLLGADKAVDRLNSEFSEKLLDEVRARIEAADLVETGGYRDSWYIRRVGKTDFEVATDRPDANRHEYGFVGRDSLGRHYTTPPRPHFRPAAESIRGRYRDAIAEEVQHLWSM